MCMSSDEVDLEIANTILLECMNAAAMMGWLGDYKKHKKEGKEEIEKAMGYYKSEITPSNEKVESEFDRDADTDKVSYRIYCLELAKHVYSTGTEEILISTAREFEKYLRWG